MDCIPQAKPDVYNGIEFRSRLESKTAQAFDNLGIPYEYEPDAYKLSNGMWYKPDFYLPDAKQYVECKGVMSQEDSAKVTGLVNDTGKPVVILGYENAMIVMHFWNNQDSEIVWYSGDEVGAALCSECNKKFFIAIPDTYCCPVCGAYKGDRHISQWDEITSAKDLFRLGQEAASDNPIYKDIANEFNNNQ